MGGQASHGFMEFKQSNPCAGCPAPCCRMQVSQHKTPTTFADIDAIRYLLLFPGTEVCVSSEGEWSVIRWTTCIALDRATSLCTLHHTPLKPQTCLQYNAYSCWYKNNFVIDRPPQIYRLDMARFDVWVKEIRFGDDGRIVSAPDFERSLELLAGLPIEPRFQLMSDEELANDPRYQEPAGPPSATHHPT